MCLVKRPLFDGGRPRTDAPRQKSFRMLGDGDLCSLGYTVVSYLFFNRVFVRETTILRPNACATFQLRLEAL